MHSAELKFRYGDHLAATLQHDVAAEQLFSLSIDELAAFLDVRASEAYQTYSLKLRQPGSAAHDQELAELYRRWRTAEELSDQVAIADYMYLYDDAVEPADVKQA